MGWGDFSSANSILLPDVEYIIGQDIAKKYDYTTDFYGKVVAKGNSVVNLIYEDRERRKR